MILRKCTAAFLSLLMVFSMAVFLPSFRASATAVPIITTQSQLTKATSVTITGTAEANTPLRITGGFDTATGKSDGKGAFSISVPLKQNETNTLSVTETDPSWTYDLSTAAIVVIIQDSQSPAAPVIFTNSQTTTYTSIVISGSAEVGTIIKITGGLETALGSASTGAFSVTVPLRTNTVNSLSVTATDAAGNVSDASTVSIIQKVSGTSTDTTPPATPTISTPTQYTSATSITITGTAEANSTVSITGGFGYGAYIGTASGGGAYSINVKLFENAVNTLKVTATDKAGNVSGAATVTITQDDIAPVKPKIATSSQVTADASIKVTGTAEKDVTVTIMGGLSTVTGTADGNGTFAITVQLNTNTVNTLTVSSTDKAGNVSDSASVDITQKSGPNTPTISTPSQTTTATSITVTGTAQAGSIVTITGGASMATGSADGGGNYSIKVDLNPGVINDLYVIATDKYGTVSTAAALVVTQEDASAIPTVTTPSQSTNDDSISIRGTASANSTIKITGGLETVSATADSSGNFGITVELIKDAVNTLKVTATDTKGRISDPRTVVITQGMPANTPTPIATSFCLITDPKFTSSGYTKYFNASVSQTSGTKLDNWVMIIVTTTADGKQTITSNTYNCDQTETKVTVNNNAIKCSVFISDEPFGGTCIPTTYSLTRFVTQ